jgi:hypothetical protein
VHTLNTPLLTCVTAFISGGGSAKERSKQSWLKLVHIVQLQPYLNSHASLEYPLQALKPR